MAGGLQGPLVGYVPRGIQSGAIQAQVYEARVTAQTFAAGHTTSYGAGMLIYSAPGHIALWQKSTCLPCRKSCVQAP